MPTRQQRCAALRNDSIPPSVKRYRDHCAISITNELSGHGGANLPNSAKTKTKKSLENQTQLLWVSVEVSATDGISETMHVLLRLNFP